VPAALQGKWHRQQQKPERRGTLPGRSQPLITPTQHLAASRQMHEKEDSLSFLSKNKPNFHSQKSVASLYFKEAERGPKKLLCACGDASVNDAFSVSGVPTSTTINQIS